MQGTGGSQTHDKQKRTEFLSICDPPPEIICQAAELDAPAAMEGSEVINQLLAPGQQPLQLLCCKLVGRVDIGQAPAQLFALAVKLAFLLGNFSLRFRARTDSPR